MEKEKVDGRAKHSKRKYTDEDIEKMRDELRNGKSTQDIANEIGVSRQRIAQLVGAVQSMKKWNRTYSVYSGIDSWMKNNRVTYAQFNRMLGFSNSASSQLKLAYKLMGKHDMYKSLVDAILTVTQMTYEEAFNLKGDS